MCTCVRRGLPRQRMRGGGSHCESSYGRTPVTHTRRNTHTKPQSRVRLRRRRQGAMQHTAQHHSLSPSVTHRGPSIRPGLRMPLVETSCVHLDCDCTLACLYLGMCSVTMCACVCVCMCVCVCVCMCVPTPLPVLLSPVTAGTHHWLRVPVDPCVCRYCLGC